MHCCVYDSTWFAVLPAGFRARFLDDREGELDGDERSMHLNEVPQTAPGSSFTCRVLSLGVKHTTLSASR
jgi:hypothetical protein